MSIQKKDTMVATISTSQPSIRSAFHKYSCQPSQFQLESIAQNKTRRYSSGSAFTQGTNSTPVTSVAQIKTSLQNQGLSNLNPERGLDMTGSNNNLSNIAELSHTNMKILPNRRSHQSMEELFDQLDNPEPDQINLPKMFIVKDHQGFSYNSLSPATASGTENRNVPHFSALSSTPVVNSLGITAPNSRPHSFTEIKLEPLDMDLIPGGRRRSASVNPTSKLYETTEKNEQGICEPSTAKSVIPTRSNFWKSSIFSLFSKKRTESRSDSVPVTTTSQKKSRNKSNKNQSTFWRKTVLPLFSKKKYTVNNSGVQNNEEIPHQINIENDENGAEENVVDDDDPQTAEVRTLPRGIESQTQIRDLSQDPESGPSQSGGLLKLPSLSSKPIDLLKPPSQEKAIEKPSRTKTMKRSITQQHTEVLKPPTTNKEKAKFFLNIIAFIIACAAVLTAVDSILTHSFQNRYIFYWIDEFFFGFFLAACQVVFLRAMIKSNLKELLEDESGESSDNLEEEKPKPDPSTLYNYSTVNMISVGILAVSGLTCALISYGTLEYLVRSPFYYLLLGFVILIIDGLLITFALRIRNKIALKKALKKRGKGFFVIPVYRDFMQDLSSTRSALNLSEITSKRSQNQSGKPEANSQLKLQKQDYEVISNQRVIASQGLFILFYLQFVCEVGFAYLYRHLQQIDNKFSILVILAHPIISFAFRKIAERLNLKTKLSMEIYITFVNWLIVGIFSKITFLFIPLSAKKFSKGWDVIEGIGLIAETIAVKMIYKGVIYVLIKKEAETWNKRNLLNLGNIVLREHTYKPQKTMKKAEFQGGSQRSSSMMMENVKRRTRLNTIMEIKLVEKGKLDAARKKDKEEYSQNFMIKVIFIELTDLVFGLSAIVLVGIYRIVSNSSVFYSIEGKFIITYVAAGALEILCGLPIIFYLYRFWIKKSELIDIKVREILRPFWEGYFKEFFVVNAMFFLNFIAIIQIFYGKLCCTELK